MQKEGRGKVSKLNYGFPNNYHKSAQNKQEYTHTGSESQYEKEI